MARKLSGKPGFSVVSVSIMIGLMLSFGLALLSHTAKLNRIAQTHAGRIAAVQIAEAGLEKVLFCMNALDGDACGGDFGPYYTGETDVEFAGGRYSTAIIGDGTVRTAVAVGEDAAGNRRTVSAQVTNIPPTDSPAFSFALQAGQDGIYMENNAGVSGSVYSNGNVVCQGKNAFVDGDAYVTLPGGKIDSCTVNYHAHADSILNSAVKGDAYYLTSLSGTSVSGVTYSGQPTPTPKDLPAVNLTMWQEAAAAGGTYSGTLTPANGTSLGPLKINGGLTLNNNVKITLNGPIWITGTLTAKNGSSITLNSSFGALGSAILADHQSDKANQGKIILENGSDIKGSGHAQSHIMLISTNTSLSPSSPAILVSNTSSGAIFLASEGMMRLNNNATARSMAARKLYLDQNAVVNYLASSMSDLKFSNSPGVSWHIVEGTWTESR